MQIGLKIAASLLASAALTAPALADELAKGFENPPNSARPRVWWHWMNGNVTVDGIEKDIAWMVRSGIGGLQNFDANLATPQIVGKRLVYMQPEWKAAFRRAVELAESNGLEFAIAASPGWSETGGPWVKPEDGMKKLVWSETTLAGGRRFTGKLAGAPVDTGPFQAVQAHDDHAQIGGGKQPDLPRAGGDIAVLAYPVARAATQLPKAEAAGGEPLDARLMSDDSLDSAVKVAVRHGEDPGSITLRYDQAVNVRSARIFIPKAKPVFGDPLFRPVLEVDQGGGWRKLAEFPLAEAPTTVAFPPVTAHRFRLVLAPNTAPKRIGLGEGAPGAAVFDVFARKPQETVSIADLRLTGEPRIDRAEAKAGFGVELDYHAIAGKHGETGASPDRVIDLTERLRPDGALDWTPPRGSDWRVLRFGWSLTGKTNHPATPEATGLEVDKYDPAAVRRYLETYLGMYRENVGPELIGARGIRALLTDSIEVGAANWTPSIFEEFRARRGYDLRPWLPALTGAVIGTTGESEKFLFDFRATLAELMADAHYGTIAKVAHERGLKVYGEALEDVRPVLGDDLAMRKYADVPMAALWTWARDSIPRPTLLGDMKGAASVAHIYGQNIVAAESMTAANAPWAFAPHDLKRIIDLEFAMGVNRPVIHTSVHQPLDDKQPGLSLMIFGQYFNRHESWAEMARPWVDYMARTGFMLQQGRDAADIAWFYGEDTPITGLFAQGKPEGLPQGYAYDFVNADILTNMLSIEGSELVAKSGARYAALYLGGTSKVMTLATLKRIAEIADADIPVVGDKPERSPSLMDDAAEFAALAQRVWSGPRVLATRDPDAAMARLGIAPDFAYAKPQPDSEVLFVHRKLADGDIYFLNNRQNRAERIEARFRVTGKVPELWNTITGSARPLPYRIENGITTVPLDLAAEDAALIVFRQPASAASLSAAPAPATRAVPLAAPWTVTFQPGRGAPASIAMPALKALETHSDAGVKYFSGIATYTARFTAPRVRKSGAPLWLDLGKVGDLAEVRVNGRQAGAVWFAPWRVEIGKLIKPGANTLEVRVANTWVNRLIGDKQPGATKVTFTAASTYLPDAPLRPSGLIGPVTLVTEGR